MCAYNNDRVICPKVNILQSSIIMEGLKTYSTTQIS